MKLPLLVVPVLSLLLVACSSGPANTFERFDQAVAAGHSAEAMELIDPGIRQVGGPKLIAALAQAGKAASAKGGLKAVNVLNQKVEGDYATLNLEETFGDGSKKVSDVKMRRVDGKWYVTF